jgi:hypothetical protein
MEGPAIVSAFVSLIARVRNDQSIRFVDEARVSHFSCERQTLHPAETGCCPRDDIRRVVCQFKRSRKNFAAFVADSSN